MDLPASSVEDSPPYVASSAVVEGVTAYSTALLPTVAYDAAAGGVKVGFVATAGVCCRVRGMAFVYSRGVSRGQRFGRNFASLFRFGLSTPSLIFLSNKPLNKPFRVVERLVVSGWMCTVLL